MQIVIDISENIYNLIAKGEESRDFVYKSDLMRAILEGIPLPKGHGDIVDIETLIDMFWDGNSMEITKYDLSVIEPIIEADKAEVRCRNENRK